MGTGRMKVNQLTALNRLFSSAYPHKKAQEIIAKLCKLVDECEGRTAEDEGIISLFKEAKKQKISEKEREIIKKAQDLLGVTI